MNKNKNFRDLIHDSQGQDMKQQCEPCISSTTIADDDKSVASHNSTFFKGLTGLPSITTSMQHTTSIRPEILARGCVSFRTQLNQQELMIMILCVG